MRKWLVVAVLGLVAAGTTTGGAAAADRTARAAGDERGSTQDVRVDRLVRVLGERHARIGVSIGDVDVTRPRGARVEGVSEDSPAAKAGIRIGDVITEFDGERVRSARQLSRLVAETPAGRAVPVTILRDGSRVDLQVTPEAQTSAFGSFEPGMPAAPMVRPMPHFRFEHPGQGSWFERFHRDMDEYGGRHGRGRLGVAAQPLSSQLAEYFGAGQGVLVATVRDDSPAAKAGLKAGDVITAVNGEKIGSPADLVRAVARAESAEITVSYVRDRKAGEVKVTLPERDPSPDRTRPA